MSKTKVRLMIFITAAVLLLIVIGAVLILYMTYYTDPAGTALQEAGITENTVQIGDVTFHYAQGPDNGPALLLLHAQTLDWYSYSLVLPKLAKTYHVFAVDYPGHGMTVVPDDYPMTADQIGGDLAAFVETVIGEPAYMTGNSSGGLLVVWLAANRPDLVRAIVLEDPPLFSSEYPAVQKTVAYRLFKASHDALATPGFNGNFLDYWVQNGSEFFKTYAGPFAQPLIRFAVARYRSGNPGMPLAIPFVPASVREMLRGLDFYNPRFGDAFYDGTWNSGFDHAKALQRIQCPTVLIQADFSYFDDGTLNGAMSQEMADRAVALLNDCQYVKIDAGHVTHLEVPDQFIQIVEDCFQER